MSCVETVFHSALENLESRFRPTLVYSTNNESGLVDFGNVFKSNFAPCIGHNFWLVTIVYTSWNYLLILKFVYRGWFQIWWRMLMFWPLTMNLRLQIRLWVCLILVRKTCTMYIETIALVKWCSDEKIDSIKIFFFLIQKRLNCKLFMIKMYYILMYVLIYYIVLKY